MGTERAQAVAVENETKKTFTYSGLKFKKSTFYKMLFRKAAAICLPQRFFYFFFLK